MASSSPKSQPDDSDMLPSPQLCHERARDSAKELRKLLTTLATASVGGFVAILTAARPNPGDRGAGMVGLVMMCLAVGMAIVAWQADAFRYFKWARRDNIRLWHWAVRISDGAMIAFFVAGVACALAYILAAGDPR